MERHPLLNLLHHTPGIGTQKKCLSRREIFFPYDLVTTIWRHTIQTSDNFFTSSCRWINRFSFRCSTTFFHCCCSCCCCLVLCKNLVSTLLQFPITPTEMEKKVLMTVFISIVQTLLDMLRVNCRYMIFYRMTCFRLQVATTFAFLWYYLPRFLLCFGGNFSNVTSNLQLPTAPANC